MATIDPSSPMNLPPPIDPGAPVGVTGTSATAFQVTGQAVKDSVSPSGGQSAVTIALDPKKPNLAAPDLSKMTDAKLAEAKNFIVQNPWFAPSFAAAFFAVMYNVLTLQTQIRFSSSQMELQVRGALYELSKTSAKLQQQITQNQAFEQLVQAVTSFVSAGVSAYSAKQTLSNTGKAEISAKQKIDAQEAKVTKMKQDELGLKGGDPANIKDEIKAQEKAQNKVYSKATQDQIDKHEKMVGEKDDIVRRDAAHLDQISNLAMESVKSALQGINAAGTAAIRFDTAEKELMKGLIDGMTQSLHKFSETTTKSRDDAGAAFDRIIDFLNRIIDSLERTHSSKGPG